MGFLRRLLGGDQQPDRRSSASPQQRPSWMRDGMEVQLYEGREDLEVVGEASYQDNLWRIVGGRSSPNDRVRTEVYAVLVAEPDNPYDANAVSVWVRGLKVGYLSRDDARRYRPGLLALEQKHGMPIALAGAIVGGGMRRAQAFSWLHDAVWMGGWRWYRAADRCGGCGCDLADVLGGLPLGGNRSVAVMLASDGRDVDGGCRMRTCVGRGMMSPMPDRREEGPGSGVDASADRVVGAHGGADPTAG
jgi:hypothetical protein